MMFCGSDLIADVKRKFLGEALESSLGIEKEFPAEQRSRKCFVSGWLVRRIRISGAFERVGLARICRECCWRKSLCCAAAQQFVVVCISL